MTNVLVRPAAPEERIATLRLLFSHLPDAEARRQAEEICHSERQGELSLEGLLLATSDEVPVGAGLFTPHPGRAAFVWTPGVPVQHPERSAIQDAILTAIRQRLDDLGLCLGQVILDPEARKTRRLFVRNGFPHLTDLHYLLHPFDASDSLELPPACETVLFADAASPERFAQVMERTYHHTLDCPELNGHRGAGDALEGHLATGDADPKRWRIFRQGGHDAGVLFLNEHPERELLEIVYLGVVPEARGQGLGHAIVQTALAVAQREERPVVLAVDARNHFARDIYRRWGFRELTVQSVHVRQNAASSSVPQSTNYAQPAGGGKRNS